MATKVLMPALSPTMSEGTINRWLVKVGDKVLAGDILAEIETDKATMEVEAVDEGIITHIIGSKSDELIKVNTVIALLDGTEKDNIQDYNSSNESPNMVSSLEAKNDIKLDENIESIAEEKVSIEKSHKILASPYAKKISKDKVIDLNLIKYVASTKKPMIISTGMANSQEIMEAIETAQENGCKQLAILHCVSGYPAPVTDYNLRTIPDMIENFGTITGISDHTLDNTTSIAAVSLGASIIEKHFTLDRNGGGPDDSFSLELEDMTNLLVLTPEYVSLFSKSDQEEPLSVLNCQ